jgi:hypothetical protein
MLQRKDQRWATGRKASALMSERKKKVIAIRVPRRWDLAVEIAPAERERLLCEVSRP